MHNIIQALLGASKKVVYSFIGCSGMQSSIELVFQGQYYNGKNLKRYL